MKVGVYIHDGFTFAPRAECPYYWGTAEYVRFLDWLQYAGVEVVELCPQLGWLRYPTLPEELDRLRARQQLVDEAHRRGLELWLILPTNVYSRLPPDQVPPGQLAIAEADCTECPQEGDGFARTAGISQYMARVFRGADAFEVFAGDWGGCHCGRCDIGQYIRYVNHHAAHLAAEQPAAQVYANLWCISYWQKFHYGPQGTEDRGNWRHVWDAEIEYSRRFLERLHVIPPGVGLGFPLHHWYRGFCQQWYRQDELPFWPDAPLLRQLHGQGRRLVAWTHFIVENDPYHGRLWGTLSVRLRYLRQLGSLLHAAPFHLVMGNVYSARQALNLYAFTRFARQPALAVEQVLADFVAEVAEPAGRELLTDVLVYLENRDPWHGDMPPYRQLPPLAEGGIRRERLAAALPTLASLLRADAPLLLNGRAHFARTVADAFALGE